MTTVGGNDGTLLEGRANSALVGTQVGVSQGDSSRLSDVSPAMGLSLWSNEKDHIEIGGNHEEVSSLRNVAEVDKPPVRDLWAITEGQVDNGRSSIDGEHTIQLGLPAARPTGCGNSGKDCPSWASGQGDYLPGGRRTGLGGALDVFLDYWHPPSPTPAPTPVVEGDTTAEDSGESANVTTDDTGGVGVSATEGGLKALICSYPWPQGCEYWTGIAWCESNLSPNAIGYMGSYIGLFQVWVGHGYAYSWLLDPFNNTLAAWELSYGGTYTGAWPWCQYQ